MTEMQDPTLTQLQEQILRDHLERVSRKHAKPEIASGLTYETAIALAEDEDLVSSKNSNETNNTNTRLPGGLSGDDLKRYACNPLDLDEQTSTLLLEELKKTLYQILDLWTCDEELTEDQREEQAMRLPEAIASQKATISTLDNEAKVLRSRLISLVDEVNEVHPRLERELLDALETLPPILEAERGARYDVLSLTIETCLLKLSLMRARMHQTVYGYTSPKKPDATMARALEAVQHKLQKKREEQEREERELDRQIREYEELLEMVDGRAGGFKQIVEDMARVKRDTEECRKDLRRLGWTGD